MSMWDDLVIDDALSGEFADVFSERERGAVRASLPHRARATESLPRQDLNADTLRGCAKRAWR